MSFRCDGMSASAYSIIATICAGFANGIFNLMLARSGYVAPVFDEAAKQTIASLQNAATQNVFTFFFLGFEIITAVIMIVLLLF